MEASDLTARQYYEHITANPTRPRFGFGAKAAIVNIDLQKAYTCVDEFATAYQTDPNQLRQHLQAGPVLDRSHDGRVDPQSA